MGYAHIKIAGSGYIVDLSTAESWWVEGSVEPFRSESRRLFQRTSPAPPTVSAEASHGTHGASIPMDIREDVVKDVLEELEQLGMARQLW